MKILLSLLVAGSLLVACAPPPEQLPSLPPVPNPGTLQQDI
jgi:hypothetical protein